MPPTTPYKPKNHIRIVTATSLFDGHDASINIMRRILQDTGAEVIHLGHNRTVAEIVEAAIQEDAHAIAVSSYQGGHIEFFKYMMSLLKERGAAHIKVYGGGGGVIVPEEIRLIQSFGVARIFSPEDGRTMGLQGMINCILRDCDTRPDIQALIDNPPTLNAQNTLGIAQFISAVEDAKSRQNGTLAKLQDALGDVSQKTIPILGITGTGGAGKSSLIDELITRFLNDFSDKTIAVLSVDPSRKRTGGALLGDRIRMNALSRDRVYMRSLATRETRSEVSQALGESIDVLKKAGFDFIIVETAGIGQGDAAIVPFVDAALYVMTAEFGAPSQLEKIDMLDFADIIAINKFERRGSDDALTHVRKQYQRNHRLFDDDPETMPIYGTIASKFNDDGVTALYHGILDVLHEKTQETWLTQSSLQQKDIKKSSSKTVIIPGDRIRYLSEISETIRTYHQWVDKQADIATTLWQIDGASNALPDDDAPAKESLQTARDKSSKKLDGAGVKALEDYDEYKKTYTKDEYVYTVRNEEFRTPLYRTSLSGTKIPRVVLPNFGNPGDRMRWILRENVPGRFPFTAGVFPFKRDDEDPTRMFAGEGDPARTNKRFKFLSRNSKAKRLSTAFDSVTLYGWDPDKRPDIYGKVGTSGVSICTLDDMKTLYDGFDLCAPNTSVSMTINGPAPVILAMFLNTVIDQQGAAFEKEHGRKPNESEYEDLRAKALNTVRGTVQADILKEDQGQNTCIFAIDFALKMMGDIQQYFIEKNVTNFYSVSISGYHIAEAGANPITQLAFTLANGFTYVEYYLSRGMDVDDFAPNLSFFFSNGMDPEYSVINRVARRIWAIAIDKKYGGSERAQKLKAHIQTSGRSLHAQDIAFNDIRTTLQALTALYDNCNSLHTNSFDEAITTPSQESVRRALAIQLIINKEYGIYKNENVLQGSFIIEELTRLVEESVLAEFDRLTERGGVLGAMETGYQRAKIQEESLYYENRKDSGEYPIIGVNTYRDESVDPELEAGNVELARGTEEEKASQLSRVQAFQKAHKENAVHALDNLKQTALDGGNIFASLMDAVQSCSLGQITQALFEVGGQYRRIM